MHSNGSSDLDSSRLEAVVLDVGHGNACVVIDGERCALVDVRDADLVLAEFELSGIRSIEHLILSHADEDHISGAAAILAHDEVPTSTLWFSPDSTKYSATFVDLLTVAADLFRRSKLNVRTNLNVGAGAQLNFGRVELVVLYPDIVSAGVGPTVAAHPLGPISSNGMSAVIKVVLAGEPSLLLAGDVDSRGLEHMIESGVDPNAPVLVFPHHGGLAATNDLKAFASKLVSFVDPKFVVFSLGRSRFNNPQIDVMMGIREAQPSIRVACTQVSRRCHHGLIPADDDHLADRPARGRGLGACCAGSIVVRRTESGVEWHPNASGHADFVRRLDSPLCK